MNKHEYNKAKRRKGKALRLQERAWKGKAQSYAAIMFGSVLERTTRLERFRAQKPSLNPDGKPAHVHSVGVCSTIVTRLYDAQRCAMYGGGCGSTPPKTDKMNHNANKELQDVVDSVRARLPR